jgi:hypothetical protein
VLRPLTSVSAVAGVGAAVATGLLLGALVDLVVVPTAAGLVATGLAVGVIVGFGEGGPVPAVLGGLLGWLVGGIVESGLTELAKGPLTEAAGLALGWCLAAFAGWLVGRVATLLPWAWVMATAAVATALAARVAISCLGTSACASDVGRTGLIAVKWSAVAIIWLYALVVLLRLRSLDLFRDSHHDAYDSWELLRPFALFYCAWWAPLLTVAALRGLSPGYRLTTAELGTFLVAMLLPLWINPFFPWFLVMVDQLMPDWPRPTIAAKLSGHSVVLQNVGARTARRVTCQIVIGGRWHHVRLPQRLPPGGSHRVPLSPAQVRELERRRLWTRPTVTLTWRDGLCLTRRKEPDKTLDAEAHRDPILPGWRR